jgi:3-oxoacyl-[acyl-carrier-protein] synthase-3
MASIRIVGTGSYVPDKVLTNHELEKTLDTTDEWIVQRTGIRERRIAEPHEAVSDLAEKASMKALEAAGMSPEDIDMIILATITPDTCCPAGANWLQAKLGAKNAVSFDVTAACTGFIFGLSIAEQYLKNGQYDNALIVGAEVLSRTLDWEDRSSCILWGDAAGAAVLKQSKEGAELLSTHIHSDGSAGDKLLLPGGGSATTPISQDSVEKGLHSLKMIDASKTFKVAVKQFAESCEEAAAFNGYSISDVDLIIPHQANARIQQLSSHGAPCPGPGSTLWADTARRQGCPHGIRWRLDMGQCSYPLALTTRFSGFRVRLGPSLKMLGLILPAE